jgi:DHA2 family multidrug resistance protein-like MFS transporter
MSEAASVPLSSALAGRREWTGLAVLALPCAVYAMDLTVLNLALPVISTELQPSAAQLLWIIDVYGFLVAGLLITMGTLGDRIGRRKLLMIGAALFAAASLLAALSRTAETLIATRALLGVAGATLAPSTLSLIRNMFHDEGQRQFAVGVWITAFSAGSAVGPVIGGVLLHLYGWPSVFLLALPVMGLLLVLGPKLLPEYRDPHAGRIDPASVVLSIAAVLLIVYGLKHLATRGFAWADAVTVVAGLGVGAAFVHRQGRLDYPLLDVALLRRPAFATVLLAYALCSLAMMGVYVFLTQYLQLVLALTPLQAGWAVLPWSLAFVVGSLSAPRWARRLGAPRLMVLGLAAAAIGFLLLAFVGTERGLVPLVAGTVVIGLGMAPVITVGNEMILSAAPPERAGAASALSETSAEFSGALGIAVLGSLGMGLYRLWLEPALPDDLDPARAEAALATLGGALDTASAVGGAAGTALQGAARQSFTYVLRGLALLGATLMVLAGVLWARQGTRLAAPGASSDPPGASSP